MLDPSGSLARDADHPSCLSSRVACSMAEKVTLCVNCRTAVATKETGQCEACWNESDSELADLPVGTVVEDPDRLLNVDFDLG